MGGARLKGSSAHRALFTFRALWRRLALSTSHFRLMRFCIALPAGKMPRKQGRAQTQEDAARRRDEIMPDKEF